MKKKSKLVYVIFILHLVLYGCISKSDKKYLEVKLAETYITSNDVESLRVLLDSGLSADAENKYGVPLIIKACSSGSSASALLLMQRGANLHGDKSKLIFLACAGLGTNAIDIANYALKKGGDIMVTNKYGASALEAAVGRDNLAYTKYLVNAGLRTDIRFGRFDSSLLEYYADAVSFEMLEYLLSLSIDINLTNRIGMNALHRVIIVSSDKDRRLRKAEFLLDAGIDVNAASRSNKTALHYAVDCNDLCLIKLLLNRGADPTIRNESGETPADYANRSRHIEIENILRAAEKAIPKDQSGATLKIEENH